MLSRPCGARHRDDADTDQQHRYKGSLECKMSDEIAQPLARVVLVPMDHAATVVVLVHMKAAPVLEREHPIGALPLRRRDQLGAEASVLWMGEGRDASSLAPALSLGQAELIQPSQPRIVTYMATPVSKPRLSLSRGLAWSQDLDGESGAQRSTLCLSLPRPFHPGSFFARSGWVSAGDMQPLARVAVTGV